MSPAAGSAALGPGDLVGPYRIEAELGEGGMGRVYAATGPGGDRVALKLARRELAEDEIFQRRFVREVGSTSRVVHSHVVRVLDSGEHDGLPYLTQQFISGGSLEQRLERDGQLSLEHAIRLCVEVASGLDTLHEAGLIHRDLKPANILLDEEDHAYITDFGLIKDLKASVLTRLGSQPGTWNYMAPEQVRGEAVTGLTDVYALGCVMCACMCGHPPFADRPGLQVGWAHLHEEPPDPCADRDDVPKYVGWAITRALAKEPQERPPTGMAFARMVQMAAGTQRVGG